MGMKFWLILNEEHQSQDVALLVWFSLIIRPTFSVMILHLATNCICYPFTSLSLKAELKTEQFDEGYGSIRPKSHQFFITLVVPNNNKKPKQILLYSPFTCVHKQTS